MKKYGKYEKRPGGGSGKPPKVKNLLLQTYFTSLLCLVLCVSMFFGTSYAWFTSEVQNTGNEIYIGTLDVGLYKQESGKWVDLASSDTNTAKLFNGNIRWEPGYTTLETIQVVNEGDLAFKYVLNFTDGAVAGDGTQSIEAVAKYFDVWVYDHLNKSTPAPASYSEITAENSGWEYAGSLDELLSGESVLDGVMVSVRKTGQETAAINKGTTDGVATEDTYTIALHMKEEADAAVMGKRISLNVKLIAYQMTAESEKDGFGNQNYDSNVTAVSDVKSLQRALSNSGNVQLITDVEIGKLEDRVTMNGGVLYGNGKEIVYKGGRINESSVGVVTTSGGTVRNLTVNGGNDGRALYVTKLTSDLFVSGCTFSGAYAFNLNSADVTSYTLNFTDTTFESWTSYANVMEQASFTACTFGGVLKPYGDTTLTNCKFATAGLDVSALENGEAITLVNCTYNGSVIENAVLKAIDGSIQVTCDNSLLTISGDMAVLNSNG